MSKHVLGTMKVRDIGSFFKKPGSSSSRASSSARDDPEEQVVEVPTRLKKGGSSKKSKKDDRLNISIEETVEGSDSDREDPLPRTSRQQDRNGRRKKPVIEDDDSDKEDPLPKPTRGKRRDEKSDVNPSHEKKRKAKVLSDSDDDDFKQTPHSQKRSSSEKPAAKYAKVDKSAELKKEFKAVNPADFFSSAPVRRETRKPAADIKPSSSVSVASPEKQDKDKKNEKKVENPRTPEKKADKLRTPEKKTEKQKTPEKKPEKQKTSEKKTEKPKTPEKKTDKPKAPEHSVAKSKTPEKKIDKPKLQEKEFKVPTPVTSNKSRSRTNASKRPISATEEDDDEEDFNPKQKASTSKSKPKAKQSAKSRDTTPAPTTDDEDKEVSTPKQNNYKNYLAKMSMKPKNLGSKDIPVGAPKCLEGLAFVISGVLDSLERDDCKDLIVKYGGRVTGAVSGKTNYLVVGDDPGESKVKKAVQLKVPQICEDDVLDMIRKSNPAGNSQDSGLPNSEDMVMDSEPVNSEDDDDAYDGEKSLFSTPVSTKAGRSCRISSPKKAESPPKSAKEESPRKKLKTESPSKKEGKKEIQVTKVDDRHVKKETDKEVPKPSVSTTPNKIQQNSIGNPDSGLMWVDKYKPKTLKTVVGQSSDTSNARKLVNWLRNWFEYHGSSQDKPKAAWPGLRDPQGKTFKAALLSGPPGIGKTTSAHLAVKEVGYDYFELNASDTRNKRGLHENVADALSSKSLVFNKGTEELSRKHVLIMDEVDGMSGNEDRGGVQELIALIKSSRVPVICICNDRNHQKIRSLANYCFDLRFNKPTFEQLKGFIMSICFKEKIKIPQEKVQQLIISTDNDVRQILHQLELFKEGKTDQAHNPKKDLRFGPWDVIRKVFLKSEHDKMSIHDKNGLFFQDYNIGPLFVQENYLKWIPAKAGGNRQKHMDLLGKTAASLADGDMVESVIRRSMNWGLLPVQAVFASYIPGEYMESNTMGNVEFPQWLGKNSNKNKRNRLLQSLHTHLHLQVSGSLEALNMDYLPYLRRAITKPLIAGDALEAAKIMENYTLLRDDVESINDLSLWPGTKDPMEKVETRVKTAFTKQVNKEMLPYSNAKPVKGKGRGGGGQEDDLEGLLDDDEAGAQEEEEEEDTIEKDAMVKIRTKKGGSSKSKAVSSSSSSGATTKGKGKGRKT